MLHPTTIERSNSDSSVLDRLRRVTNDARPDQVLRTAVNILRDSFESYSWVGIYIVKGENLILAAYAGENETEHVKIPIGQGICGLAAKERETIIVPDVSKDARYLMCFPSTRSEIVVPIRSGSRVLGEIDIDSDHISAFNGNDRKILEQAATVLAGYLEKRTATSFVPNQ